MSVTPARAGCEVEVEVGDNRLKVPKTLAVAMLILMVTSASAAAERPLRVVDRVDYSAIQERGTRSPGCRSASRSSASATSRRHTRHDPMAASR